MKRLLFTAGGSPGMEAFYRYLKDKYELFFADMNPTNISPTIPDSRKYQIPSASSELFISHISELCDRLAVDLLIPGVDEELVLVQGQFPGECQTKVFLPKPEFVSAMLNKYTMNKALEERGIDVPQTVLADDYAFNPVAPVILKPAFGRGSRGVFALPSDNLVKPLYDAIRHTSSSSWIIQENVEGDEFTVQMVSTPSSALLGIIPLKVYEKRGSTVSAVMQHDEDVIKYCKSIHEAFRPDGCYNIQLIKRPSGEVLAFEINPRISTTTVLCVAAGLDPFLSFLETQNKPSPLKTVPTIKLHRHWVNQITVVDQ